MMSADCSSLSMCENNGCDRSTCGECTKLRDYEASTAALVTDTNVVLQVNRSHLDRMVDFLTSFSSSPSYSSSTDNNCSEVSRDLVLRIVATKKSTASKSCSLLFLHVDSSLSDNTLLKQVSSSCRDVLEFIEDVMKCYDYVLRGLNKIYVMTSIKESSTRSDVRVPSIIHGRLESSSSLLDEGCWDNFIDRQLLNILGKIKQSSYYAATSQQSTVVVVKVDVFPMKLQHQMISNITKLLNDNSIPEDELDISPTNYTHTLSIVQLDNAEQHNNKIRSSCKANIDGGCHGKFLVGVTNHIIPQIYSSEVSASNNDDIICRAYCKLEEVFHRYPVRDSNKQGGKTCCCPLVAVDCGSAPGGWTKFLAEHTYFDIIYSIDPAMMDIRVSSLPMVQHLQMTSEDAIPHLCQIFSSSSSSSPCNGGEGQVSLTEDDNNINNDRNYNNKPGECVNRNNCKRITLWVSDMCLHEYTNQVDTLLRVHDMGILCPNNCAFVLTLKFCNAGHGRVRYDELAMEEACRLQVAGAYDVKVMHLFSNRLSERTLVGFI